MIRPFVILRYGINDFSWAAPLSDFFSLPLLTKAKRSVGNKESGLDMLGPKIKLR